MSSGLTGWGNGMMDFFSVSLESAFLISVTKQINVSTQTAPHCVRFKVYSKSSPKRAIPTSARFRGRRTLSAEAMLTIGILVRLPVAGWVVFYDCPVHAVAQLLIHVHCNLVRHSDEEINEKPTLSLKRERQGRTSVPMGITAACFYKNICFFLWFNGSNLVLLLTTS